MYGSVEDGSMRMVCGQMRQEGNLAEHALEKKSLADSSYVPSCCASEHVGNEQYREHDAASEDDSVCVGGLFDLC